MPAEARADLPAEVLAEVPAELDGKTAAISSTSLGGRSRERNRKRNRSSLRVRFADADPAEPSSLQALEAASEQERSRADALAQAPAILRETLELFFLKTGRHGLGADESSALRDLERAHTPAVIQRAISAAVARFVRRGQSPMDADPAVRPGQSQALHDAEGGIRRHGFGAAPQVSRWCHTPLPHGGHPWTRSDHARSARF